MNKPPITAPPLAPADTIGPSGVAQVGQPAEGLKNDPSAKSRLITPTELVAASRAESVPTASAGPWTIRRVSIDELEAMEDPGPCSALARQYQIGVLRNILAPFRSITMLERVTWASVMHGKGDCVMEDSPQELRKHLPILIHGSGRVLVSGLGLGCVVRGLLAKPSVRHVDVVEICPYILALVGPEFYDNPRVTLHRGDALTIGWPSAIRWDWAWHDIWSEDEELQVLHAELLRRYQPMVANKQGAWNWPREAKRLARAAVIG